MSRTQRNILILLTPILFLIGINEYARNKLKATTHKQQKTINSAERNMGICTWRCHYDTNHCKQHHVKFMKPYFKQTDPLYFGLIRAMESTKSYTLVNVLFLGILWPLLIYCLFIRVLDLNQSLMKFKKA